MRLKNLAVLQPDPTRRENRRIRHERPEFFTPSKISKLADLMHVTALVHGMDRRNRVTFHNLNFAVHDSPLSSSAQSRLGALLVELEKLHHSGGHGLEHIPA